MKFDFLGLYDEDLRLSMSLMNFLIIFFIKKDNYIVIL